MTSWCSRVAAGAVAALFLAAGTAPLLAQSIKVASEASYPPFSKTEADGRITGFEIDLGNEVCARVKITCEWVKQDFDGMIAALLARKFDMVFSSMSITEERKKVADFSIPYYASPHRFIGKAGAGLSPTIDALKGRKIGVYAGSVQEKYIKAKLAGGPEIVGYKNMDQIGADLVAGRLDGAFVAALVGAEFLKSANGKGYEFVGPELRDVELFGPGTGAMFRKGDELKGKVDAAIREIYKDGAFDKISSKYFEGVTLKADGAW